MLEARNLSWCQSRGALVAGINVTVSLGEWISLVGPNGAGKSTLLQVLAGTLEYPSQSFSGSISWQDQDWTQLDSRVRASRVAYLGSELESLFPIRVIDAVSAGQFAAVPGQQRQRSSELRFALSFCELEGLLDRDLATLSGGERQRVLLARGLVQGAQILFLDETFGKMDLDYQFELGARLQKLTREGVLSVVLVSHDPSLSGRFADRVWLINQGRLVANGQPDAVLNEESLSRVFPRASLASLFKSELNSEKDRGP